MKWRKTGLIWGPDGSMAWARHSALQPTPLVLGNRIRVYVGVRDDDGVGRVSYVDVDADDPARVLDVSGHPVLDIGEPGTFDDNGVIPCAAVRRDDGRVFLYYAGYQIPKRVKFLAFGGLAISHDDGRTFTRYSQVPVLERTADELYFKATHCVLFDEGVWKFWYSAGSEFITNDRGYPLPKYDTRYVESADGIYPNGPGEVCMPVRGGEEYRLGRASVIRTGEIYRMFFVWGTPEIGLRLGYAESRDGRTWERDDSRLGLEPEGGDAFDSRHMSYPNIVERAGRFFLFYNGNDYGRAGFGVAELESWS